MIVVSTSYGNDSIACIQWAKETEQKHVVAAYSVTGWAAPWWAQRVAKGEALAHSYGFQTVRIESLGMADLIRDRKGWPGNGQQFCTAELKGFPFLDWIEEADAGHAATVVIGKRRAESKKRANTTEFIESSEYHGGRRVWHPLYLHSHEERNELVRRAGFEVLPHRSLECNPCVNANRGDFLRLTRGEIERVNDLEVEIGKTMFRPKRFGALGIYGVIQWAKYGRDRGDIEDEEAECGSMFGCEVSQ